MDFWVEDELKAVVESNLDNVLAVFPEDAVKDGVKHYEGKVRENFTLPGDADRVSVFDQVVGTVPFKGQVLDELTHWWFDQTSILVDNHIKDRPSPVVTLADECEPLMVEMVVRGYLTGSSSTSIWPAYEAGKREFCGHPLPDGMKKNQRLPYVMVTPSTKAAHGDHDESISAEDVLFRQLLPGTESEQVHLWEHLNSQTLALFGMGAALSAARGLILVDTKYEFGRTNDGRIVVFDEVHTPDSSRFWELDAYAARFAAGENPKSLSKQFVREVTERSGYNPKTDGDKAVPMLQDEGRVECAMRYIDLCQRITGKKFEPDTRSVEERVYRPLEDLGVMRKAA